ncbi:MULTISPECIES: hypothetical protein [Haloferax]|uniref:Uncharacterized protein n=1 Tax=Haloferax marinum TaxID=2666143 RepID=A0A6A8GCC7_9EURY|nr:MULTISPECIES: hypothetical protein [Haloferax]KAB1190668.1 hypothetical protein Hfx1150_16655 [Haloferax sp. CBA1150]MRW98198.1 hypothetical protein [Haloferax marinum]
MSSDRTGHDSEDEGSGGDLALAHSLWVRWRGARPDQARNHTDDTPLPLVDVHIHRFCDIAPGADSKPDIDDVELRYVDGAVRTILRYTPTVIFFLVIGLMTYAELSPDVEGISVLLPSVSLWVVPALLGGSVIWGIIVLLVDRVGLIDRRELLKVILVWGLVFGLLTGSLFATYLVLTAPDPTLLGPNIIYTSGYLLMLLVGGLLVYDGALRTETLLDKLPEGNNSIVEDSAAYEEWITELKTKLTDTIGGFSTSHVFALLFVSQFAAIWVVQSGPQNLDSNVVLGVNLFANFILVIVAFKFLVLVKYIHLLMTDQYTPDGGNPKRIIRYEPFHYDRRGGFRDFGRFATRVNVLLLVAGLYTVFRLYVQGLRVLPAAGITGFETPFHLFLWIGNFVVPIIAYAIAAGAWVYYSFWAMHRKMVMDKRIHCKDDQGIRGGTEALPTVGDSIDDFDGGLDWYYLDIAPEWPINSRYIASLVSANAIPLLLPLFKFLG